MNNTCPHCGEPQALLRSQDVKICATGCGAKETWLLNEGQKPLLAGHRFRGANSRNFS